MAEAPAVVIIDRIAACVAGATIANGYLTDVGLRVDRQAIDYMDRDFEFPRVCVLEEGSRITSQSGPSLSNTMDVVAEGYVLAGAEDSEQAAQRVKYDLAHALSRLRSSDMQDIGRAAVKTIEVGGELRTVRPAEASQYIVVQAVITVTYVSYPPPAPGP